MPPSSGASARGRGAYRRDGARARDGGCRAPWSTAGALDAERPHERSTASPSPPRPARSSTSPTSLTPPRPRARHRRGRVPPPRLHRPAPQSRGAAAPERSGAVLGRHRAGSTRTRSELEEMFLRALRRARPPPARGQRPRRGPRGATSSGPTSGSIVEIDGAAAHGTRSAPSSGPRPRRGAHGGGLPRDPRSPTCGCARARSGRDLMRTSSGGAAAPGAPVHGHDPAQHAVAVHGHDRAQAARPSRLSSASSGSSRLHAQAAVAVVAGHHRRHRPAGRTCSAHAVHGLPATTTPTSRPVASTTGNQGQP